MNLRSFKRFFTAKPQPARRPQRPARKAALQLEALEDRSLMSTLSAPIVTDRAQLDLFAATNPVFGPQAVMDPVNPDHLVEVHSWIGPSGGAVTTQGELWGNYSLDRGTTWASTAGVFLNTAILDPATNEPYAQINTVSVTFDRTGRNKIYVVSTQHSANNDSGAIVFNRFTLDTVNGGIFQDADDSAIGDRVLYRWFNTDVVKASPAYNSYIAIDNNEPTYTDPITGLVQTDTLATLVDDPFDPDPVRLIPKSIWVAWNVNAQHRLNNADQSVSDLMIAASADGGHNWTTQEYILNNSPNTLQHYIYANEPRITFSQGTPINPNDPGAVPRIQGGTMNVLFTDSLNGGGAELYIDQTLPDGGNANVYPAVAQEFIDNFPRSVENNSRSVIDAFSGGGPNNGDTPNQTNFVIDVNFDAAAFSPTDTLADLDVELNLVTPHTSHLNITLTDPNGFSYNLLFSRIDNAGNTIQGGLFGAPRGLPDANDLGVVTGPNNSKNEAGLLFDLDAPLNIADPLTAAPWVGHFRPNGFGWGNLIGETMASLNGQWTLTFTDVRNDGQNPPPQTLLSWGLHFASGIDTNEFDPAESFVATAGVRPSATNNYPSNGTFAPAANAGIPPSAVFAYDNTLGSFSPYQGRLYAAYTSGSAANPNVSVRYSDDNGASWSQAFIVNDDSPLDGFSEGNRAQYMPSIAVDPVTGTVVVSYYDGRMDSARTRVASSIAVSIDGGRSWSPSVFLNDMKSAGDFLTGSTINIEPIPGNQGINGIYGFGDRQGLIAYEGRAIPVFATNLDAATSRIRTANVLYAAGPRVVSGDMGPVNQDFNNSDNPNVFTYNNVFASDGTRQIDGLVINFDRPIDPSSLNLSDITVIYRDPTDPTGAPIDISSALQSITPLNIDQQHGAVDGGTQPTVSVGDGILKEGNSGNSQMVFEIMLSQPQLTPITVGYATAPGTAISTGASADFVAKTGSVVIPVGQVRATFTVDIIGDVRNEGPETFRVNVTSLSPGLKREFDFGIGRIIDDDDVPTISIGDAFIHEGNAGTKIMSFPVILSVANLDSAVGVNYSTATVPGGAAAGVDFTTASGTVIFLPGQTVATIDITIQGDALVESTETFLINLVNPVPGGTFLGRSQAVGTIFDNDTVGAPPIVLVSDAILKETDAGIVTATFTATLSQVQGIDVLVDYQTLDGSAVAGQDYVAKTGQAKILAGQTTATFTVNVNGDVRDEGILETFSVNLTSATPGVGLSRAVATARIVDDDDSPTITIGDPILKEGDSGFQFMRFPVALSIPNFDGPVTFNYATFDGSAVASTATLQGDYNPTANPFTFAPGQTTGFIDVAVFGDIQIEPGSESFGMQLSGAVGASFARSTAFGFIIEDDNIGTPPTISIGDAMVKETQSGVVQATFKLVLSQKQSKDVVVGFKTRDGGAVAPGDYGSRAALVVIPKEQTEVTFTINVFGDTAKEGNEIFFVDLTSVTAGIVPARTTGVATIVDDDGAPAITVGDAMVREGDNGTLTMSFPLFLNIANAVDDVSVDFALAAPFGAGAAALGVDFNYSSAARTFTFTAGQTSGQIDVTILGDQVIEAGNERFFLDLSNARNASIARPRATGIIADDDLLGLTVGDVMVQEGNDSLAPPLPDVFVDVPVYLNAATSRNVTFTWITEAISATPGADYTQITSGTGMIPAGSTATTIQVPILYDTTSEALETFRVRIVTSTNAARVRDAGIVSIVDNDQLPDVSIGDVTYREGTVPLRASVPVYLSFPSATPVTIPYTITGGPVLPPYQAAASVGSDYTVPGPTITIPAGQRVAFIDIPIVDDRVAERTERLTVTLGAAPSNAELSNKTSGVVTIVDNDVTVSIGDRAQFEGGAGVTTPFTFQLFLSSYSDTDVVVSVSARSGTATIGAGNDFTFAPTNVTIPAGQLNANISISVIGENAIEAPEDFFVDINSIVSGNADIAKATGHGIIVDDDDSNSGTTTWTIGDGVRFEGNSGNPQMIFPIFAFPAPGAGSLVRYTTIGGSAVANQDFVPVTNVAAVLPNNNSVQLNVAIDLIGDQLQEPGVESFSVRISNPSTGALSSFFIGGGSIVDDDQQVMVFSDFSVVEGNSGTVIADVPVVLSNPGPTNQIFDFQFTDGTAIRPVDYFFTGASNSFIPTPQTVRTLPMRIVGELLDEGNEDFSYSLSSPLGNLVVAKDTGNVTIINDDDLLVSVSDVAVQEGAGLATFRVFLNARPGQAVQVTYTTVAGTASDIAPGDDFTPGFGVVNIPAGFTSATFTVPIINDTLDEGNETFTVQILGVVGAGLDATHAIGVGTIVDDDLTPALSVTPGILREAEGAMAYTVYSSFPIAAPIDMTVSTANLLASAGPDYNTLTNFPLSIAADTVSAGFTVTIHDDLLAEGNEDFQVTVGNATQGATFTNDPDADGDTDGNGLIVDNEPAVSLNIGDLIVKENDSGTFTYIIPVILSEPINQPVSVFYRTINDTATADTPGARQDFVGIPGTAAPNNPLVIPANSTIGFITVTVNGDGLKEGNHQFFVELFDAVGATVAKPVATVSIIDDDSAFGATQFLVRLTPQSRVGTYSYAVGPNVTDRVQWWDYSNKPVVGPVPLILANVMDQNNNSLTGENDVVNAFANDRFAVPTPDLQVPFRGPYDPNTLPLIIPGPHLVANGFKTTTLSAEPNAPIPAAGTGGTGNVFNDTGIGKLTVAGLTGQVADVNVRVNVDYPNSSHLVLRLRAPNGQVVLLAQQRGSGNAYTNTTFDDQAATSVVAATAPFGAVRPEGALSAYNYLDADKVNGEWRLEVEDVVTGSTGNIFDWSMTFTMTNAPSYFGNQFVKQSDEAIPDLGDAVGNPNGILFSNMTASGLTGWITDVNVTVNIDYPNSGDLRLFLHAPNGAVIELARNHGDGNFYLSTVFDDQAVNDISTQDPFGPFYRVHPFNALSLLNGIKSELLNGNWQLEIRGGGSVPGGVLHGWTLDIKTSQFTDNLVLNNVSDHLDVVFDRNMNPATFTAADVLRMVGPAGAIGGPFTVAPLPGAPASMANRAFRISFPAQQLSGTYQLTISSDIQSAGGARLDSNLNVGLDILNGGTPATGTFTAKTYAIDQFTPPQPNTTDLPLVIPPGQTVSAAMEITDQFKIVQGTAGDPQSRRIQVSLNIARLSSNPDLNAVLVAPDGTEIRLFSAISILSNQTITFDDFATSPVAPGGTFAVGTFNPQIPLGRLQGKFTSGLWQLRITNNASTTATLNSWSLRTPYYQSASGLGEANADQFTTGFRIFTMDATNPLSDSTWTPIGPASSNQYGSAGRVTAIAVDPSDPSGNTVYIGSANGGVWKTSNFMTTAPQGPSYVPLTDLGPSNSLNINYIAVQPVNNNPLQSIIFVATGDTDTGAPGIGLLRSLNGGATWQVIDSRAQNFDASGNALPLSSGLRDHLFVGTRVNKVVVDPTVLPNTNGERAVYIAVGGGGIQGVYRSLDTGKTWTLLRAGNATDLLLAPASASSTGTLQLLYAAFEDEGIFYTTSAPSAVGAGALIQMVGGIGKPNHRDLADRILPVTPPPSTPNGNNRGRILLATPYKTGDRLADTFLQNWLYALVIDNTGLLFDLYVTKDRGDNWTRVVIPVSGDFNTINEGFGAATNDENVTGSASIRNLYPSFPSLGGDFEIALTIDPSNPNIVYLAGDLILKVDITTLNDPWAVVNGDHSDNVAGAANGPTVGTISPGAAMFDFGIPATPDAPDPRDDFFNMYRDPYNPFLTPSTFTYQAPLPPNPPAFWTNNGTDIRWNYLSGINDVFNTSGNSPFRVHELLALRDPLTGLTRLLVGNDQGVFTAVDRGDATLHTGIGSADSVRGSRNGNLQIAQMLSGAIQPSTLAADVAGSLAYGMALNNGTQASSADLINSGNLNWQTYDQTGFNDLISTAVDGNGTWIVTDATGGFDRIDPNTGTVIFDPNRIGTTYQYRWPCCINQVNLGTNDFFIIDFPNATPISRATGLLQSTWPVGSFNLFTNGTPRPFGRFAVNPLDPGAMVISSQAGRLYRSAGPLDGYGILWTPIAEPAVLDQTAAQALAFGSPAATVFNLNDFIYAGTNGGRVFVTVNGGGAWRNISTGLDGGPVLSIIPNPRRGSNEVYAVTGQGVYWMADSSIAAPTWVKLNDAAGRDSLFNFTRPVFNNPNDPQAIMLAGQITTMAIDWRYAIPDNLNNPSGPKHPVLYVAGNSGVFRSIDKGVTWNLYPDAANNGAPQEGGFLPNVYITDLDLMLGYLNPQTGATSHASSQNLLMATTYGRGAFAIRLDDAGFSQFLVDFTKGPKVNQVQLSAPNPGSVLTGFQVRFDSLVDATTFSAADVTVIGPNGQSIPVVAVQEINTVPGGGLNPHNLFRIVLPQQSTIGNYRLIIGPNLSDFGGNLMNQDNDNTNGEDPADRYDNVFFFQPNTAPTISAIPNQSAAPNTVLNIPFKIADAETPNNLTLSASVDQPALIPVINFNNNANPSLAISLNPTINVTLGNQIGTAVITVTVTDLYGRTASTSFSVFINNPPTLLPDPIPNVSDSHSNYPKFNYVTLSGTDPDPGDVVTFQGNAYSSPSFAANTELVGYVAVNATTGQVDLTPAASFVGTYYVRVSSTDSKAVTSRSFTVTVTNNTPSLAAISDIFDHRRGFPKTVTLNGTDPDPGETLTYSAVAYESLSYKVYKLDQSLGLFRYKGNDDFNKRKKKEKYVRDQYGQLYYILPNGQFFRFLGTNKSKKLRGVYIDTLSSAYWANTNLLASAVPTVLGGFVSTSGNQSTITPGAGFLGTFVIETTVSDGAAISAPQKYNVTVYNNPPRFNSLVGPVVAQHTQFPQVRTLDGGDPDSQDAAFISYSAQAYEALSYRARQLDAQYGLTSNGKYLFNKYKQQEKHIKGAGNKNFYILPDGRFFIRTNPATALKLRGVQIATLSNAYWANPALLWNSLNPTPLTGFTSVAGNQISFTPPNGFAGDYYVDAYVSDGQLNAVQSIQVTVLNQAPTLQAISDRSISHTVASFQETLVGSDPSNDPLTYSAVAFDGKLYDAYLLDQANNFTSNGAYDTNARGFNERYFSGAGGTKNFVVFPDGTLYRFFGGANTPFVFSGPQQNLFAQASFDASFWQDPSKLWNAAAPTPFSPSPVSVAGNVLTFTTPANFAGRIYVQAFVSDGAYADSKLFKVFITNSPPTLDPIPDQNVAASGSSQTLDIVLNASDADGDPLTFLQPQVFTLSQQAYQLDQQLGLFDPGNNFYFNYYGFQEKWLRSSVNNNWYAILPNGELHVLGNLNAGSGIGPVVAVFDANYYNNPALLYNAQNPGLVPDVTAQMIGNTLRLTIGGGFNGTFRVLAQVTDGIDTTSRSFFVNVQ